MNLRARPPWALLVASILVACSAPLVSVSDGTATSGSPEGHAWPLAVLTRAARTLPAGQALDWGRGSQGGILVWTRADFPAVETAGTVAMQARSDAARRLHVPLRRARGAMALPERQPGEREIMSVLDLRPGEPACSRWFELRAVTSSALVWADVGPVLDSPCQEPAEPLPDSLLLPWVRSLDGDGPEEKLLPGVIADFGGIPTATDADGDPRIHVVLSPAVGAFGKDKGLEGFFWPGDLDPGAKGSNQREVVYLRAGSLREDPLEAAGVLVHELAHLVAFSRRREAGGALWPTWWDEGMAMWAMERHGHGLAAGRASVLKDVGAVLADPTAWSLTDWAGNPRGGGYGLALLYVQWLAERMGPAFLKQVLVDPAPLGQALSRALSAQGTSAGDEFLALGASMLAVGGHIRGAGIQPDPPAALASLNLFDVAGGPWFLGPKVPREPGTWLRPATLGYRARFGAVEQDPSSFPQAMRVISLELGPTLSAGAAN